MEEKTSGLELMESVTMKTVLEGIDLISQIVGGFIAPSLFI
jgi:hypothetical protein